MRKKKKKKEKPSLSVIETHHITSRGLKTAGEKSEQKDGSTETINANMSLVRPVVTIALHLHIHVKHHHDTYRLILHTSIYLTQVLHVFPWFVLQYHMERTGIPWVERGLKS